MWVGELGLELGRELGQILRDWKLSKQRKFLSGMFRTMLILTTIIPRKLTNSKKVGVFGVSNKGSV